MGSTVFRGVCFCLQEQLVEACIADGNLKDALKLVNAWNMQSSYPDLEAEYEERTMEKLLNKSLWNAAAGFAIGKPKFQVALALHYTTHNSTFVMLARVIPMQIKSFSSCGHFVKILNDKKWPIYISR